ncbi:cilia- and flagella-associated protein 47-like [Myripristis murdjan]|uniref:cilia- and flagella-associated protein 47-like n=1 Tax=Myripristis murdjan TaxID=586833 RepID=UPI001175CF83|nr:cilia- and flagella-associated protein 47 [Myripristis murdjan]
MAGNGVRVDPPFVEFNDVQVGQVFKTTVTATNVGKTSKKMGFQGPMSKLFSFKAVNAAMAVAPGLSVSCSLEFSPEREEEVRDRILLHVDALETIEIPLLVFPRSCVLLMDTVVDFGSVAASSQLISKQLPLTNQGSAPGKFQVQYCGDPSLRLSPCSGVIAAGATQWLKVELHTDRPRHIEEKALVKVQNCSTVILSIRAKVVDQCLELYNLQGTPLSSLWFGPVYFGTSCVKNVVLRNNGPQACDWVSVLQDAAAGTEMGTDLQKNTNATLVERVKRCCAATQDGNKVLACIPNQGRLGPYDKTMLTVCFSPLCKRPTEGKKCACLSRRRDYSLFLLFESVGSKHGFTHRNGHSSVELAVTGSGLPVSLVPSPSENFNFLSTVRGQHVDMLCVLQNLCPLIPINFRFRKTAHFTTVPSAGTINPGQCQDVVLSFTARQQGSFRVRQKLDVLGPVFHQSGDDTAGAVTGLRLCSFHTLTLHLLAVCRSETTHPEPKLNPGITPVVTNPTGSRPHVRSRELSHCSGMVHAAVLSAAKTRLHTHCREGSQSVGEEELVAFPNDRAASIRPASPHTQYRTIFTGMKRYCYMDPDYAFTEKEEEQRQRHRQIYIDFISQLRQTRLQSIKDRQQRKVDSEVDIGIVPAQGLFPPKLLLSDLETNKIPETKRKLSTSSPLANNSSCSLVRSQVTEVMNAVPSTSQEVADCSRTLTAQELYQIIIGPLLVDFGEVCVQSVCVQRLELANHLSVNIWVQLEVDCPELQGSWPLSHVLPPLSRTTLPLVFQSHKLGSFHRPISYSVNQQHSGQVVVQAQVVPLALELSTAQLVLSPTPSLLAQSGFRSSVTLRNRHNHAVDFKWRPVVTERGILFSIRPAAGTVEAYRELDCEVVWQPSFSSPAEGDFDLCVHEGNTQRLHCVAKVCSSSVQLADKHLTFGSVPLNMSSIRTAVLHNTGQNHAYYQVLDVCPLPGMVVSPASGVVPAGGQAALKIHFNPDAVIKFDSRVEIALRNMKSIELRLGGSVEPPHVDLSVSHFQFHGVHVGSQRAIPFTLSNRSSATARVTFDLSQYTDFTVRIPQLAAAECDPGVRTVEVKSNQTADCSLVLSPTRVAGYDFKLPMVVNGVRCPTTPPSPVPTPSSSTSSGSLLAGRRKHIITDCPRPVTMAVGSGRVQATVICAPLDMSPTSLEFHVKPQSDSYTQMVELRTVCVERVCWRNVADGCVYWRFDCGVAALTAGGRKGGGLFSVSPSSGSLGPGQSVCVAVRMKPEAVTTVSGRVTQLSLPLFLGEEGRQDSHHPYRELSITITLHLPNITILPPRLLLTPVPLDSTAMATLTLLASGYPSGTTVLVNMDEVELEDGTKVQPVSVVFPQGNTIPDTAQDQEGTSTSLICTVSFCSAVPLSLCSTITFTDHLNNRFQVKVCAVADNCLLTVWPYMALHRSQQQIVLKTGIATLEAVLQRCHSPSPTSGLTLSSSSSSFAHFTSPSKNSTSDSFPDSESVNSQTSRHEEFCPNSGTMTNPNVPGFPSADSAEGPYYQSVLSAAERWFSLFGWPNGSHPITIPYTLRRVVSKIQTDDSCGRSNRVIQIKDSRSVLDMLHHLTGKKIPGIPRSQSFSKDIEQRTNQLLQQHETMLSFLRVQGACLCHIRPEYLLDMQEFNHWCTLQVNQEGNGLGYSRVDYESLSKQSWTDVLLQIYKVFVLRRVSEGALNSTLSQQVRDHIFPVSSLPLASNVYSTWELCLLSWLNMHFQSMRKIVWGTGDIPSAHWVVNFDLDLADGLVLAALLAAYCPYLISSHFRRMYTRTSSLEQILHNNIILVQALTKLSLNIDVQPTDLSDPNPVQMLMLCVHLYEKLPQYLPLRTITLSGGLHCTLSKQVCLKSPSSKPLKYQALILGEDAPFFSLPDGSAITIPPNATTEVTVQYCCSFLRPLEVLLLLTSSFAVGPRGATLAFTLKTHVSHITSTKTVKCKSPMYQMKLIELPITNPFNKEARFRVVLVESKSNPLEPEKRKDILTQQVSFKTSPPQEKMSSDSSCEEEMEGKFTDIYDEGSEFFSAVKSVCLKPGQEDTLNIHYLPFYLGNKYCSVLLVCPQVGDMVYMVKATAELPLPSSLTAKPGPSIATNSNTSDSGSMLSLHCKVGQVCDEVLHLPLVNTAWEQALATWGQYTMSAEEHRRRALTHTLDSSTVRANTVARRLTQKQEIEYRVEVSLPKLLTLPHTIILPIRGDTNIPQRNPADRECVDMPLRFQADSAGRFICQLVLMSWCDTRVYLLEALVTSQEGYTHLDFSSPTHQPVSQDIPLYNESHQDWKLRSEVCGEGFFGPKVLKVPAGTKACYPLTFKPSKQCIVMGKLSLLNDCDNTEHTFTLRGVGERPLPVDHVVLHCSVGQVTHTQLQVPNYSQYKLTLKVVTDLSVVSGAPSLEIKPGQSVPYTLTVSPWKRGKQSGCVSFLVTDEAQGAKKNKGNMSGHYEVYFSLEIICEPAAPVKVIDVQCAVQSSVVIEIPVSNPHGELLLLDVCIEGEDLSGAKHVSVPPRVTFTYKATFSPGTIRMRTGSVVFQSQLVGEFWYQLELCAVPLPVNTLPEVQCQLGKWIRQTIPLVNPTAEPLELTVANTNPRNYRLEMASGSTLIVVPRSCMQLGVRFSPSSIGEGNHTAQITFTCPQLKEWCFLLSGRGLTPKIQEPLSISSTVGSHISVIIPFTNPTELPALLSITLTDEDPSGVPGCHPVTVDKEAFCIPLRHTQGVRVSAGASLDVPVVFAPRSMELQQAQLCIFMEPLSNQSNSTASNTSNMRSEQELPTIRWVYPLRGIPMEASSGPSELGVFQCEAGCLLEEKVEVELIGCVPGNQDSTGEEVPQDSLKNFLCELRSDSEAERSEIESCVSVSVQAAKRHPESGIVKLTLNLVYTPLRPHRCSAVLEVQCVSGGLWMFPITLVATELQVDDVINIAAVGLGKTSAAGFRLTSTTRRPERFTVALLPGSSNEFMVTPTSGVLPPVGSTGTLITLSFTPTVYSKRHRARLRVQAADMHWTYEVRGRTPNSPPHCTTSSSESSPVLHSANKRQLNFVALNRRLPALANSSHLKVHR